MSSVLYTCGILACVAGVIAGIRLMNSPRTAVVGNLLGACALGMGVLLTLVREELITHPLVWCALLLSIVLGGALAFVVKTIQMPQTVGLLNGLGGAASALVGLAILLGNNEAYASERGASALALIVGAVTFSGSLAAAGKLSGILAQKPVHVPNYRFIASTLVVILVAALAWLTLFATPVVAVTALLIALVLGLLFAIRIGGADMPITISLLNSMSGISAAIAGFAVNNLLLVAVGAIVGAAGFILTRIMCDAMNRSLTQVLAGATTAHVPIAQAKTETNSAVEEKTNKPDKPDTALLLQNARSVIIVPGYGMALSQAQEAVKELTDTLQERDKSVKFAIHPVAGRMPGHMHVLLAEVDIPYDMLFEMDAINEEFATTDLVIVVGANDVVNPAASTAENTPIYGMPILKAGTAAYVLVCNLDDKPGYAGVPNSLYTQDNVTLIEGNAAETVRALTACLKQE